MFPNKVLQQRVLIPQMYVTWRLVSSRRACVSPVSFSRTLKLTLLETINQVTKGKFSVLLSSFGVKLLFSLARLAVSRLTGPLFAFIFHVASLASISHRCSLESSFAV